MSRVEGDRVEHREVGSHEERCVGPALWDQLRRVPPLVCFLVSCDVVWIAF